MKNALAALSLLTLLTINADAASQTTKPNILFILADDTGIDDYGCYGSDRFKGRTPNIDSLAHSGIRFARCYSEPLCGPSRCTLMTGRYVFRTGGLSNPTAHTPSFKTEPSLAKTLKEAGYTTGLAGKWRQMGDSPGDWGFDEFITDNTAGGWYWKQNFNENGHSVQKRLHSYGPDVCLDFAKDFLRRHRDGPFFFFFPTHLVHGPIVRTPDSRSAVASQPVLYDDMMAYLDRQVGELVAELDRLGLREMTLIVFSGDNGTAKRSGTIGGREICGAKGSVLEGGSRVPLIANWKGVTRPNQVLPDLVDFTDFFPTFASLAGARMPDGLQMDGHSFAPQLQGQAGEPRDWIFVQLGARWYARNDGWKLTQAGELYDLRDAPFGEQLVPRGSNSTPATAARKSLQAVLDELNPAGGRTETSLEPVGPKAKRKTRRPLRASGSE
jgi:arylsulfatase A